MGEMAKKYKSSFKWGFEEKERNRKRRGATMGSFLGAGAELAGSLIPVSRKKRKTSHKKKSSSTPKKQVSTQKKEPVAPSEPFTFEDFKTLLVIGIFILIWIKTNFWVALIIAVVAFVADIVIDTIRESEENSVSSPALSQLEIEKLQSHLANIDICKDITNNSSDENAVRCAMDELLESVDFIMGFDEESLRTIGMSKMQLPKQREFLVQHYDVMLEQARERHAKESALPQSIDDIENSQVSVVEQISVKTEDASKIRKTKTVYGDVDLPSLEERVSVCTPSKQGLFPHEILMLSYATTYKTTENTFQKFWLYSYSVRDPQAVLSSLCDRGFLCVGDLRSAIEKQKVVDLKNELQSIGERVTGKKAELVERLLEKGDLSLLARKYSERYYALTELGQQELNENEYVVYLHRRNYMSVWDMNYLLYQDNPSGFGYRDILWREFNRQSTAHFQAKEYGYYRNVRLDMYEFLMEEENYQSAFSMLCEVTAFDLNGLEYNGVVDNTIETQKYILEQTIEIGFPYSESAFTMPPAIIGWMEEIKEQLKLTDPAFRAALSEHFEKIYLPRRIFTNDECVEIVMNEIGNHPRKQAAIYKQAEERLRHRLFEMQ